jgi:hypothetical protein
VIYVHVVINLGYIADNMKKGLPFLCFRQFEENYYYYNVAIQAFLIELSKILRYRFGHL